MSSSVSGERRKWLNKKKQYNIASDEAKNNSLLLWWRNKCFEIGFLKGRYFEKYWRYISDIFRNPPQSTLECTPTTLHHSIANRFSFGTKWKGCPFFIRTRFIEYGRRMPIKYGAEYFIGMWHDLISVVNYTLSEEWYLLRYTGRLIYIILCKSKIHRKFFPFHPDS